MSILLMLTPPNAQPSKAWSPWMLLSLYSLTPSYHVCALSQSLPCRTFRYFVRPCRFFIKNSLLNRVFNKQSSGLVNPVLTLLFLSQAQIGTSSVIDQSAVASNQLTISLRVLLADLPSKSFQSNLRIPLPIWYPPESPRTIVLARSRCCSIESSVKAFLRSN